MVIKGNIANISGVVKKKVKPGGFIIADNVLWGGKALDESTKDQQTRGIIEFNK